MDERLAGGWLRWRLSNIGGCGRETPLGQKFDKIASIEMAEHVGIANFVDPYLTTVRKLLKRPDSSFLLQVSGLRQGANWQVLGLRVKG